MLLGELQHKSLAVLRELQRTPELSDKIEPSLGIPNPFRPRSVVKLIILGQDPTVKRKESRASITVVLNLDKGDAHWHYLHSICRKLRLSLHDNVYATNLVKNFFVEPPASYSDGRILSLASEQWLPLVRSELEEFPEVPVIALGEPLLQIIAIDNQAQVKKYWGYPRRHVKGDLSIFQFLRPEDNRLGRIVFPFPHQPSARKKFYQDRMSSYIRYVGTFLRRAA